jgi:uncharacterized Fe-S cluster protein YjdI
MHLRCLILVAGVMMSAAYAEPVPEKASPIKDGNDLQKAIRLAIRTYDGEKLKTEQDRTDASHARGYLKGLKEASWVLGYSNDQVPYILPTNITSEQVGKVILHYLVTHPEKREKASYEVVALALTEAFRNPKWQPLSKEGGPKPPPTAGED